MVDASGGWFPSGAGVFCDVLPVSVLSVAAVLAGIGLAATAPLAFLLVLCRRVVLFLALVLSALAGLIGFIV